MDQYKCSVDQLHVHHSVCIQLQLVWAMEYLMIFDELTNAILLFTLISTQGM